MRLQERDIFQSKFIIYFYTFMALWHYFFSSSMILRLNPNYFWPAIAVIGLFLFWKKISNLEVYRYDGLFLVSIMIMTISCMYSSNQSDSLKYVFSMVDYYMVARVMTGIKLKYSHIINFILIFSMIFCGITYIQILLPNVYLSYFINFLPAQYHETIIGLMGQNAYTGFTNQTSTNAFLMAVGIGIVWYKYQEKSKRLSRFFYFITMLLFLFALFETSRRGTTLIVLSLLLLLTVNMNKKKVILFLLSIGIVAVPLLSNMANIPGLSNIYNKFIHYTDNGDVSNGRFQIWSSTIEGFTQKPFLGHGIDSFTSYFSAVYAHNSYIQILFELGIIGFFFYFLPFVYVLFKTSAELSFINKNKFNSNKQLKDLLWLSIYFQLLVFLSSMFEGIFQTEQFVFMIFVFQLMTLNILQENKKILKEPIKCEQKVQLSI